MGGSQHRTAHQYNFNIFPLDVPFVVFPFWLTDQGGMMSPYARKTRTSVLNRSGETTFLTKDGLGGDMSPYVQRPFEAVPKATFFFAMAVMDKVEGWNEEKWVGSYLAASMWIHTKALCDGRKRDPPLDLEFILAVIVESVSWVTEDSQWDHEWITETKVTMKENLILEALHYNIEVPCPHQ